MVIEGRRQFFIQTRPIWKMEMEKAKIGKLVNVLNIDLDMGVKIKVKAKLAKYPISNRHWNIFFRNLNRMLNGGRVYCIHLKVKCSWYIITILFSIQFRAK